MKLPDGCKKKKDCTIDPLSDVDQEDFVRYIPYISVFFSLQKNCQN